MDKTSGDLEEHIEKKLCEEKGITEEDIENETDEYVDAIGFMTLEYVDFRYEIDEETYNNMMKDCKSIATKENIEGIKTFLNLIRKVDSNYHYYDKDLNHLRAEKFVDLIDNAVESSKKVMIDWVYYID